MSENCHTKAMELGFPYIRGEGKTINNIWHSRFTKKPDGDGPALYVGFDPITFKFVFKEEDE